MTKKVFSLLRTKSIALTTQHDDFTYNRVQQMNIIKVGGIEAPAIELLRSHLSTSKTASWPGDDDPHIGSENLF